MKPENVQNKRILFSPLNWGMGHVARSISLLKGLAKTNTLFIACDIEQQRVYEEYLSDVEYIPHEGYPFDFKGDGKFGRDLFNSRKELLARLNKEFHEVKELVKKHSIELVLSDHRYGFRSDEVDSVFITHQLNLSLKWYQFPVQWIHKNLIKKFDLVWIVDKRDNRLAGKLSHQWNPSNQFYIGHLSRFVGVDQFEKDVDHLIIASGPVIYANQLIRESLDKFPDAIVIGGGDDGSSWLERDQLILRSKNVISRSGYSTIMDLEYLDCTADLIATPGQVEQEYLLEIYSKRKRAES